MFAFYYIKIKLNDKSHFIINLFNHESNIFDYNKY